MLTSQIWVCPVENDNSKLWLFETHIGWFSKTNFTKMTSSRKTIPLNWFNPSWPGAECSVDFSFWRAPLVFSYVSSRAPCFTNHRLDTKMRSASTCYRGCLVPIRDSVCYWLVLRQSIYINTTRRWGWSGQMSCFPSTLITQNNLFCRGNVLVHSSYAIPPLPPPIKQARLASAIFFLTVITRCWRGLT